MPHIINTNTGYCETHKEYEYVVMQAGSAGVSGPTKPNKIIKLQDSSLAHRKDIPTNKESQFSPLPYSSDFQVKVFEDKENRIYKDSNQSKLNSQPKRILVKKELTNPSKSTSKCCYTTKRPYPLSTVVTCCVCCDFCDSTICDCCRILSSCPCFIWIIVLFILFIFIFFLILLILQVKNVINWF